MQHWYRIPVESVAKHLKNDWPPAWLAFYQTKLFGDEAYAVNYYARVLSIQTVERRELFPTEAESEKSKQRYYQLKLSELEKLPRSIISRRQRRVLFIPTSLAQLHQAVELQDLVVASSTL